MPALVAGAHEEGGAGDRRADGALVDQLAAGLVGAAEEGVGRAADAQALAPSRPSSSVRASATVMPSGFSEWTCLPAASACRPTSTCAFGHGQVDDDLDRRVGEQVVDARAPACRTRLPRASAAAGLRSATRPDVEDGKDRRRLEIGRADVAAADDADADAFHGSFLRRCSQRCERRAGGVPRRAVEVAQRHGGGAARPDVVAPTRGRRSRDTSARLGGVQRRPPRARSGPSSVSPSARVAPVRITFGGANSVIRLAMAMPSASPAAARRRRSRRRRRGVQRAFMPGAPVGSAHRPRSAAARQDRGSEAMSARRAVPAGSMHDRGRRDRG